LPPEGAELFGQSFDFFISGCALERHEHRLSKAAPVSVWIFGADFNFRIGSLTQASSQWPAQFISHSPSQKL
jgi:hypothetical protein